MSYLYFIVPIIQKEVQYLNFAASSTLSAAIQVGQSFITCLTPILYFPS